MYGALLLQRLPFLSMRDVQFGLELPHTPAYIAESVLQHFGTYCQCVLLMLLLPACAPGA